MQGHVHVHAYACAAQTCAPQASCVSTPMPEETCTWVLSHASWLMEMLTLRTPEPLLRMGRRGVGQ